MRFIYPFPMHISKGYSYMLSIIQFLNELSKIAPVDLLCLDDRPQIESFLQSNFNLEISKNLKVINIKNKKFGIKSNKVFFHNEVRKYLMKQSGDIFYYTRDIRQMRLGLVKLKPRFPKIKFIFEAHQILSQNYCRNGEYSKAKEAKKIESLVFSKSDYLVLITKTLQNEIQKIYQLEEVKQILLPVGFDERLLKTPTNNKKQIDVLYSGNFSSWKGLDILLNSISIIKKKYSRKIKVVLVGGNNIEVQNMQKIVHEMDLTDYVSIKNRVEHKVIRDLISESKVGVLTNKYNDDGFLFTSPLKLYEYIGSGMKVVCARLPSIESVFNDQHLYFSIPENPESIAKKILEALDDKSFDALKLKNYAKDFTWKSRANNFISRLNENINNKI